MRPSQITDWCHAVIRAQAARGGLYIDATMGNGKDTCMLCELAQEKGKVIAFDIQKMALEHTEQLLRRHGYLDRASLILDGHEHMDHYVEEGSADVVCFNFGYLPGGDHKMATKADTSVRAVEKGLRALKPGGMMSLCIYSGGDTGFEEKEKIMEYIRTLSPGQYTVIVNQYYNRENHPPVPVFIFKR